MKALMRFLIRPSFKILLRGIYIPLHLRFFCEETNKQHSIPKSSRRMTSLDSGHKDVSLDWISSKSNKKDGPLFFQGHLMPAMMDLLRQKNLEFLTSLAFPPAIDRLKLSVPRPPFGNLECTCARKRELLRIIERLLPSL